MDYKKKREEMFDLQDQWADNVALTIHGIVGHLRDQAKSGDIFAGALSLLREKFGDVIHIDAEDYVKVIDGSKFNYIVTVQPTNDGGCDILFIDRDDMEDKE